MRTMNPVSVQPVSWVLPAARSVQPLVAVPVKVEKSPLVRKAENKSEFGFFYYYLA